MKQINSIVIYPHSRLKKKTSELDLATIKSENTKTIINDMIELMYKANGVGLAAPQVDLDMRLAVVDAQDGAGVRVFINPVIVSNSMRTETIEEGCLSIPGVFGRVKCWRKITVEYLDQDGNKKTLKAHPFLSRVIQHEIDHLDGILFIDKLDGNIKKGKEILDAWNKGEKPLLEIPYPYKYE